MQYSPSLTTPNAIRKVLFAEPSQVTDPQLLTLFLGMGTMDRRSGKSLTAVQLAEALLAEAGGRLTHLVSAVHKGTINLRDLSLRLILGGRLMAAMGLAYRWRTGFQRGGNAEVRSGPEGQLSEKFFKRKLEGTEGELVAIILGRYWPIHDEAKLLLAAYASPRQLVQTLTPDAFEVGGEASNCRVRHSASGVWLGSAQCCRLLTAVELARRHRKRFKTERSIVRRAAIGLRSPDLLSLLDPTSPLDAELRSSLFAALRAKPELAEEVAEFDRLTSEAQTNDYHKALELHVMFEALRRCRKWTHPREVLGDPVPYPALLSIAEARIKRGDKPPGRFRQIKQLLETAEGAVTREPIKAFVAVLLDLELSESGAKRAFKEARQRYYESRQWRQAPVAQRWRNSLEVQW